MLHLPVIINGIHLINEGKTADIDWQELSRALLSHLAYLEGSLDGVLEVMGNMSASDNYDYFDDLETIIKKLKITQRQE